MEDKNIYDVIVIGGGASGLFCAATYGKNVRGLILEKTAYTGKKLQMSGGGQCNVTHGGNIKEFVEHYGDNGKKIRGVLYKFNNDSLRDFFEERGVPMLEREDGKVFPRSLDARDVLDVIRKEGNRKGFHIMYEHSVYDIEQTVSLDSEEESIYKITCEDRARFKVVTFLCKKIIVATGGCSYPTTGSDGNVFAVLGKMGLELVKPKPALVPIFVQDYPYEELSGISFCPVRLKVGKKEIEEDLLLTHTSFSGPAAINISRYVKAGDKISINYCPGKTYEEILLDLKKKVPKNSKQIINFLLEYLETSIPKRFIEVLCKRCEIDTAKKVASLSGGQLKRIAELLTRDEFSVSGIGGFNVAMATAGGVSLSEVDLKTMECKKYSNMFIIGEALDIDGDTGGYNLQFAFSSGYLAGSSK